MRNIIGLYTALGLPVYQSIRKFQNRFNFSEDDRNAAAIKQDFYRHGSSNDLDFNEEIFKNIKT